MSNTETPTFRDQLKSSTNEELLKANTRAQLEEAAGEFGLTEDTISAAKTKADLLDMIIGKANLPDPGLRGMSEVDSPVAYVWQRLDEITAEREANDEPRMRRKDAIQLLVDEGVAFYTARTQYQSWFSATGKGARRLADLSNEDLPKPLQETSADDVD